MSTASERAADQRITERAKQRAFLGLTGQVWGDTYRLLKSMNADGLPQADIDRAGRVLVLIHRGLQGAVLAYLRSM